MTEEHYRNGLKISSAVPVINMIPNSSLWMQMYPLHSHRNSIFHSFSIKPIFSQVGFQGMQSLLKEFKIYVQGN